MRNYNIFILPTPFAYNQRRVSQRKMCIADHEILRIFPYFVSFHKETAVYDVQQHTPVVNV